MEVNEVLREIGRYETTAIYGAHVVAFGLHTALRELYGVSVKCHLVTDPAGNPAEMGGKPVLPVRAAEAKLFDLRTGFGETSFLGGRGTSLAMGALWRGWCPALQWAFFTLARFRSIHYISHGCETVWPANRVSAIKGTTVFPRRREKTSSFL